MQRRSLSPINHPTAELLSRSIPLACSVFRLNFKSDEDSCIIIRQFSQVIICSHKYIIMKQKKDQRDIMQDFKLLQSRQFLAIALTLLLLILLTLLYISVLIYSENFQRTQFWRTDYPYSILCGIQRFKLEMPIVQSLGNNINRRICKKCGTRLW